MIRRSFRGARQRLQSFGNGDKTAASNSVGECKTAGPRCTWELACLSTPRCSCWASDLLKEKGWARLNVGTPDTYAPHVAGNFPTPSAAPAALDLRNRAGTSTVAR